jgi:hypothetical protein
MEDIIFKRYNLDIIKITSSESINLSGTDINSLILQIMLKFSIHLKHLNLSSTLVKELPIIPQLESLDITNCMITKSSYIELSKAIVDESSCLKKLSLGSKYSHQPYEWIVIYQILISGSISLRECNMYTIDVIKSLFERIKKKIPVSKTTCKIYLKNSKNDEYFKNARFRAQILFQRDQGIGIESVLNHNLFEKLLIQFNE